MIEPMDQRDRRVRRGRRTSRVVNFLKRRLENPKQPEVIVHLETIAVHAAAEPDGVTGSVAPPIHLSTTFEHGPASEHIHGYSYIREANPTQTRLETALAQLEGGEAALAFASGMGAGSAVLQTLAPGSHVIMPDDVYVDFRNLAKEFFFRWQLEHTVVDTSQIDQVRAARRTSTQLIWLETPSNPLMKVTDIAAVAELAREIRAKVLVDNTFATPILQRPLELGADIVLHSTTKYFGGHSDVQGGALIFAKKDEHSASVDNNRRLLGAAASPFTPWLVLRVHALLACRMRAHSANAMAVARALSTNPAVEAVHYPGLPSRWARRRHEADERFWWHVVDSNQRRTRARNSSGIPCQSFHECNEPGRGREFD
jgi:cystathionine gamma-synthase